MLSSIYYQELDDDIKDKLKKLCLDEDDSTIINDLNKSQPKDAIILIKINDEIIAWALINTWEFDSKTVTFQCFVDERYRRLGYGTKLWFAAKNLFHDKKIGCFSHDDVSKRFFNKMKSL